jgi:FKBP-type peptidyl-prolyl cis-trans isomerase
MHLPAFRNLIHTAAILCSSTLLMAETPLEKGEKFLKENAGKEGVKTTASGLQYKIVKEGEGKNPSATDTVLVHYKGTLLDGKEFDSSYKRNMPIEFPLNRVIPGWTEGLQLVKEGGKAILYIPSKLAYGSNGTPGGPIGPDETLIFEVELLKVK